jgi:hypothetical protein
METNNKVYNQLMAEKIQKLTGFTSNQEWVQCLKTNSTYMDCPVAQYATKDTFSMWATVQNPSSIDSQSQRFAVPEAKYSAEVYDFTTNQFKNA